MKIRLIFAAAIALLLSASAFAQVRPAPSETAAVEERPVPAELPSKIEVEYRGGIFGFSEKEKGSLSFDVINERLIFSGKDGKELFSIPYDSIYVVYPSQKKVRSGTGRAIGAIPLPGAAIGGLFMKKKKNYLVIEYKDPEVDVEGTANFLVDTGDELFNGIHAIGQNAEMVRRGDAYIRKRRQ